MPASGELCDLAGARLHRLRDAGRDLGMCRFELSKLGPKQHEQTYRRGARNGRGATTVSENCDLTKEVTRRKFRQRLALGRDGGRSFANEGVRLVGEGAPGYT
jgi:hypothetical protein